MLNFLDVNDVEARPWSCGVICANWSGGIGYDELGQFRSFCKEFKCTPQVAQLGQRARHAACKCECYKREHQGCESEKPVQEKVVVDRSAGECLKVQKQECDRTALVQFEGQPKREVKRYRPMRGFMVYPHNVDESDLSEFRTSLGVRTTTQGKRLGMYDLGSMGYFNHQHYEVYSQLIGCLSKKHTYYIPGDGDGIMAYLMWKRKYKYCAGEPSALGSVLKRLGLLGSEAYDPNFCADVVLFLNVLVEFTPSHYHLSGRFVIIDDTTRAVPDWLYSYEIPGTQLRLFSNFMFAKLPSLSVPLKVVARLLRCSLRAVCPTDSRHRVLCEDFGIACNPQGEQVGENVYDLFTGQDHFAPNKNGDFFGRRGDYFVIEGVRHDFSYGRRAVSVVGGVLSVNCIARKRVIYRIEVKECSLQVRLARYKPYVYGKVDKTAPALLWEVVKGEGPWYQVREQHNMKYLDWMYGKTWYTKCD